MCGCSGCNCECLGCRCKCPSICYLDVDGEGESIIQNEEIQATSETPVISEQYQVPQGYSNASDASKNRIQILEKELKDVKRESKQHQQKADETIKNLMQQNEQLKFLVGEASKVQEEMTNRLADKERELKQCQEEKQKAFTGFINLKIQIKETEEQNKNLSQQLAECKEKLGDVSNRLSKEMEAKVSSNESDLENVSMKNRPMNVSEEYQLLMSNQWYDTKSDLDELRDVSDWQKLNILNSVIVASEVESENLFSMLQKQLKQILFFPSTLIEAKGTGLDVSDISLTVEVEQKFDLPKQLSNAAGDFLRKEADMVNLEKLEKRVYTKLQGQFESSGEYQHVWATVCDKESMKNYISSLIRLAWKMAIQRPAMKFKHGNKWKGNDVHERYWGSSESPDAASCQVYPMLYHGDQLMVKGKIYSVAKA